MPRKNKSNDYGFDPHEQATETYTGMGADINVHDQWAVESMGAIQDRTSEHLGTTDKGIVLYRRLLGDEIEEVAAARSRCCSLLKRNGRHPARQPLTVSARRPDGSYWKESDETPPWRGMGGAGAEVDLGEDFHHLTAAE